MGSSYAAGPGVGLPDSASSGCSRSLSNAAQQVAKAARLTLTDVACSGATTDNLLLHGQNGFAAQMQAVSSEAALVTILIGGNDIDYVGNLQGLFCQDSGGSQCQVVSATEVSQRLAALPQALDQVIEETRRRAPHAALVLIGYLPAMPEAGMKSCSGLGMSATSVSRMRDVAFQLNQAIAEAAARHGTALIRSDALGEGHEICSDSPFVSDGRPARNPNWSGPVAFHPTQAGMDRVAQALMALIGPR